MSLPTLADAKAVLRLLTTNDDAFVTQLLTRAQAAAETLLGVRITAASDTQVIYTNESTLAYNAPPSFVLTRYPIALSPAPTITDNTGATVDASTYAIDPRTGVVRALAFGCFPSGPYTVVGNVGMSAHPDYATRIEPVLNSAILDLVADYYDRRAPGTVSESDGGGFSQTNTQLEVPPRIAARLNSIAVSPV